MEGMVWLEVVKKRVGAWGSTSIALNTLAQKSVQSVESV